MPPLLERWKERAEQLEAETYALYLAYRHPRVKWYTKLFAAAVAAYAFSPIDLIPDFIPVLGYLDDLVIVPLGVMLALRLIPSEVMAECRAKAKETLASGQPRSRAAAAVIIVIWLLGLALAGVLAWRMIQK